MPLLANSPATYNRMLLLVAGLGGLLYGIDVGIIAGAYPYMEATSGFNAGQLSFVVAAVLLGQRDLDAFCGHAVRLDGAEEDDGPQRPAFCREHSADRAVAWLRESRFRPAVAGRERRPDRRRHPAVSPRGVPSAPKNRGKGTGLFQWLLVFGFVIAAIIALYFQLPGRRRGETGRRDRAA